MAKTKDSAAETQPPLLLSFAIALPLLDFIGWVGCLIYPAGHAGMHGLLQHPAHYLDLQRPEPLLITIAATVLLGLVCSLGSLLRRESLRGISFLCLVGYIVAAAYVFSRLAQGN